MVEMQIGEYHLGDSIEVGKVKLDPATSPRCFSPRYSHESGELEV